VAILLITSLIVSCDFNRKSMDRGKTFSLTIVMDSTINSKSYYGIWFLVTGYDSINYDTVLWDRKQLKQTYRWNRLKAGDYQIEIKTVYHHPKVVSIALRSDTVIKINNDFSYQFVNLISKKELSQADTIDFAFESGGHFSIWKYQLVKLDNHYWLSRSSEYNREPLNKVVTPDIINDLYEIQKICRKNKNQKVRGFKSYQYILIVGKKEFFYDDNYTMGTPFYNAFLNKYDIRK